MNGAHPTTRSVVQIVLFAAGWMLFEFALVGPLALAFVILFSGGFLLWWFTSRKAAIDPQRIIVPYLLTVIMFIVHVFEEYKAHLLGYPDIVKGAPFPMSFELMVTFAASLAPIVWILGAVMMLRRWAVGFFVVNTFLFGMMFIEASHFVAPFVPTGRFHYVGGLWTAILPITFGWYTFLAMRREMRRHRRVDVG